jgi:hypothetical protein
MQPTDCNQPAVPEPHRKGVGMGLLLHQRS